MSSTLGGFDSRTEMAWRRGSRTHAGRRMSVIFLAILVLALLLPPAFEQSGARAQDDNTEIPVAQAVARIQQHADAITRRIIEMDSLYEGSNFGGGLEQHIQAAGGIPVWSDRHTIRWAWENDRGSFYSKHRKALQNSILTVRQQGYALASQLDYLDRGMAAWTVRETQYVQEFAKVFDIMRAGPLGEADVKYQQQLEAGADEMLFEALAPIAVIVFEGGKEDAVP